MYFHSQWHWFSVYLSYKRCVTKSHVAVIITSVLNVSVSHVSQCWFRTGAGPTSDQRRGGAAAATGSGYEQRGCRAGTHTSTETQAEMVESDSTFTCHYMFIRPSYTLKFAHGSRYICRQQFIIFQKMTLNEARSNHVLFHSATRQYFSLLMIIVINLSWNNLTTNFPVCWTKKGISGFWTVSQLSSPTFSEMWLLPLNAV